MSSREPAQFDPRHVSENEIYRFLTTSFLAQNQLMYSRLQLMIAIEVASLAGALVKGGAFGFLLLLIASAVVVCLWLLAIRDRDAGLKFLRLLDLVHKPLGIRVFPAPTKQWFRGSLLLAAITFVMLLGNIFVILLLRGGFS